MAQERTYRNAKGAVWSCVCGHDPCDGLGCGVYLPGEAPRKPYPKKSKAETKRIRSQAWATRRAKYGPKGHR